MRLSRFAQQQHESDVRGRRDILVIQDVASKRARKPAKWVGMNESCDHAVQKSRLFRLASRGARNPFLSNSQDTNNVAACKPTFERPDLSMPRPWASSAHRCIKDMQPVAVPIVVAMPENAQTMRAARRDLCEREADLGTGRLRSDGACPVSLGHTDWGRSRACFFLP